MNEIKSRPYRLISMTAEHIDAVADLERACFSHPRSRETLAQQLENLSAAYIVAEATNGKILGYAGLTVVLDEGYIDNIAVGEPYRRCGVASALLDVFLRFARANHLAFLTLEVRASNAAAIALYQKYGFRQAGCRRDYYEDPREDALLMTRKEEETEA